MARRVTWSAPALEDLTAAAEYIARDSRHYAAALVRDARDAARSLARFPERGRDDIKHLAHDINSRLEEPLDNARFDLIFEKWWPDLERGYKEALTRLHSVEPHQRDQREILEEILLTVRSLGHGQQSPVGWSAPGSGDEVLSRPLTYDSLAWYTLWKFPGKKVSGYWQDRILNDIDRGRYPTIYEIDGVVNRARDAVFAYSRESPEVFGYGTDFLTKSLGFVDEEFRLRHGFSNRSLATFLRLANLLIEEAPKAAPEVDG
jgi:hypothetical protein